LRYALVTAVKNEEFLLPALFHTVSNQSILPERWIIVNDNSTDKSTSLISSFSKSKSWVEAVHIQGNNEYNSLNYSIAIRKGCDRILKLIDTNLLDVEYIGLVDADVKFTSKHFEKLMNEFYSDKNLGICSGDIYYLDGNKITKFNDNGDYPVGTIRFWSYECFIKTGGFIETHAPDTVSNIKAIQNNFKIKRFKTPVILLGRGRTMVSLYPDGIGKSFHKVSQKDYFLHVTPPVAFLKSLNYLRFSLKAGFAYFTGYFSCLLYLRPTKLKDKDIELYFRDEHLRISIKNFILHNRISDKLFAGNPNW
jgi:glycosyltransferase involved in cell wall biosynthesis